MRVLIDPSVADDAAALRWLTMIQHRFEDQWHLWEVDDADAMLKTAWLRDPGHAGISAREVLKKSLVRLGYPTRLHRRAVLVVGQVTDSSELLELSPEMAARFLDQPLVILLENRRSDGAFLDAVVATLGGDELARHWERQPCPVRKDSLGGKGQMLDHVKHQATRMPPPRLLVVRDGDGDGPLHLSPEALSLQNACQRRGISCWLLEKREVENYLPDSLLEKLAPDSEEMRERLGAWKRLSEEQKDFWDVRHGLGEIRSQERLSLFAKLARENDRHLLGKGFGTSVSHLWGIRPIDKSGLRDRAGDELERLLNLICENL